MLRQNRSHKATNGEKAVCPAFSTGDDVVTPLDLEVHRLSWALEAFARSARALMRARSLPQMAQSVCNAIAARHEYLIAAIVLSDPAPGKGLRFIASAGRAREYLDGLVVSWDENQPSGLGPTGRGIRSGEPFVMDDALNDPIFAPWRERARPYGIRASTTVPFGDGGDHAVGAVVVYASVPHAFSPREVAIFRQLGEELAFAMTVLADQQQLEEARQARAAAEAEARARQAEMAQLARALTLGEFASSITHEITQPLAAVITNIETAQRYLAPGNGNVEAAGAALDRALRDADRATHVIRETRRFLAQGNREFAPTDINRVVGTVIDMLAGDLAAAAVVVETRLADGLPPILASEVQLEQVVINLVVNAREALQDVLGSRRIAIRTGRAADGAIVLTVADNGPGMSAAARARVFEHFYTTKPTGMGMGLAISRSLVEAHGGRLRCEPNEPAGTVFCMTLPPMEDHDNDG